MENQDIYHVIDSFGIIGNVVVTIGVLIGTYLVASSGWAIYIHLKTSSTSSMGGFQDSKFGIKGASLRAFFGYILVTLFTTLNVINNTFGLSASSPEASLAIESSLGQISNQNLVHIESSGWMTVTMFIIVMGAFKVAGLWAYIRGFHVWSKSGDAGAENRGHTTKRAVLHLVGGFFLYNSLEFAGIV